MSEDNNYDAEVERRVQEILIGALTMEDEREREAFVRRQCGDDPRLLRRALADLEELRHGEGVWLGAIMGGGQRLVVDMGEEVGNYKIIEQIKQGRFATVYSAEHKISKTFAAIKIFDRLAEEVEKEIIWNKEGKSLSKLDHDNIVKFYDLGFYEKDGKKLPYVIVELVKGKHLDEHCKWRDPSVREVLSLFRSLCGVIEYIHSRTEKLLHLDLKPSNIFVTASRPPRIKLIDFGSSKLFRTGPRRATRNDFINLLTAKFASPEQFDKDDETDHQSDIYSLGAILYLLFTERIPFGDAETDKDKIKEQVTNKKLAPVAPSRRVLEIEKETKFGLTPKHLGKVLIGDLDFIILKCLQKRRRDRYASVSALIEDIDNYLKGKPLKSRRGSFTYTASKFISYLCGVRGGLSGAEKWRRPFKRLAVAGGLLGVVGLAAHEVNRHWLAASPFDPKRIVKPDGPMPLRVKNESGGVDDSVRQHLYIYCGEEVCFTFFAIPEGGYRRMKIPGEKVEDVPASVEHFQWVNIKKFYMGRFEVTNKQWNNVARSKKIAEELVMTNEDENLPKTNVSYAQAYEFCARLSRDLTDYHGRRIAVRLPSEAEWEYACRGGNDTKFGGGNEFDPDFINAVNIPDNEPVPKWAAMLIRRTRYYPLPVSSFVANPYGLSAMNGNVWEMVSDRWHDNYKGAPDDGTSWDLTGDKDSGYVLRGGAFSRPDFMAQCSYRTKTTPTSPGNIQTGFRIVLDAKGVD